MKLPVPLVDINYREHSAVVQSICDIQSVEYSAFWELIPSVITVIL